MKYIFFGTPDVAKETLEYLVLNNLKPELVVTNPDAPKGRGHIVTASPVKDYAMSVGIPLLAPEYLDDDFTNKLGAIGAELGIVVAYGKILPEELIKIFPKGVLNIHYSLLPRWRGAAPVEYALLNDDLETGVTIQKMVKKLDAGDILSCQRIPISDEDTTLSLRSRLIQLGAELLVETLPRYLRDEIEVKAQEESDVTFAPKLKKEEGEIKLDDNHRSNWNKYRAFKVWPGTYFFKDDRRYKVTQASFKNGIFHVERVVPEGGREIDWEV